MADQTAHREKIRAHDCCTSCNTNDHWEPSTCGRILITCASGQAITYTTHRQAWVLWCRERVDWRWNGSLLSSVIRIGSVCMRVMEIHMYYVELVSVIFRSAFAHDKEVPPQASWGGGHQLQFTFGVFAR